MYYKLKNLRSQLIKVSDPKALSFTGTISSATASSFDTTFVLGYYGK